MESVKYGLNELKGRIVRNRKSDYLLLFFYVIVVYFPIALFIFSLKNDATTINLPIKLFFSESLRAGEIPLWNPFLKSGFPMYADPGFSYWNPITWIFGITGYNAYTFQAETILYIFIGTAGFYKLSVYYGLDRVTSILAGCLYCTSGFVSGSLEFTNYLCAGAFFPFCLKYLDALIRRNRRADGLYLSIAAYFLLNSGHPAIPIGSCVFFALYVAAIVYSERKQLNGKNLWRIGGRFFISVVLLLLMLLPMIYSLIELMPHFNRGKVVDINSVSENAWESFPYILTSLANPFIHFAEGGIVKGTLYRTSYLTMVGLALVIFNFRKAYRNPVFRVYLFSAIISLFFVLPGIFNEALRNLIPGFEYIKHFFPFRLFLNGSVILLIAIVFQRRYKVIGNRVRHFLDRLKIPIWTVIAFLMVFILFSAFILSEQYRQTTDSGGKSVFFFNSPQSLIAAAIIAACIVLWVLIIGKRTGISLLTLILAETILFTWITIPVTGFSKTRSSELNRMISELTASDKIPDLVPLNSFKGINEDRITKRLGNWSFYKNQVVMDTSFNYPSYIRNNLSDNQAAYPKMANRPFVYLQKRENSLSMKDFSPDEIGLNLKIQSSDTLVLFQNNYPGWILKLGDKDFQPLANPAFCSFPIQERGNYKVSLEFRKPVLKYLVYTSIFSFLIFCFLIFKVRPAKKGCKPTVLPGADPLDRLF